MVVTVLAGAFAFNRRRVGFYGHRGHFARFLAMTFEMADQGKSPDCAGPPRIRKYAGEPTQRDGMRL